MIKSEIIFSIICGFLVAEVLRELNFFIGGILFIILPILSVICLLISREIGKKFYFVFQLAKHILVGIFSTVADLKFFELLIYVFPWLQSQRLITKALSFIFSTAVKYPGNRLWTFKNQDIATENGIKKEFAKFFITNLVGLCIDIFVFKFFLDIVGPQFALSFVVWRKICIIMSAVAAGIWNFTAEKFLVFKNN